MVKRLLAMQETWVQSLDQEVPLEKEMATHSSTLAWRIPWMEEELELIYRFKSTVNLQNYSVISFNG